jgi:phosphoglycerate dehydrogenase-like enzyme
MDKLVVYFGAPEEFIIAIGKIASKFEIVTCTSPEQLQAHLGNMEILFALFAWPDSEIIRSAPKLRWIQALTAGIDFFPLEEIKKQGIILTTGRGIHKLYIAEYAIAAMINLARNFHLMFRNQLQGNWDRSIAQDEVHGTTVGILGLGSIGREVAIKAAALGMHVIGTKYNPEPLPGVDRVYGPEDMEQVFKQSDYVINLLPGTPHTLGLIDKTHFKAMKSSACFINLGRGSTVVQDDLIEALQSKTIRAMVSDVYEQEPLPHDSPLWQLENVILTPHIAGVSPKYLQRAMEIIRHNLEVYISRRGEMINMVDLKKGY